MWTLVLFDRTAVETLFGMRATVVRIKNLLRPYFEASFRYATMVDVLLTDPVLNLTSYGSMFRSANMLMSPTQKQHI